MCSANNCCIVIYRWNWMPYVGPYQNYTDVFAKRQIITKMKIAELIMQQELLNLEETSTDNTLSLSCTINLIIFSKSYL